MSEVVEQKDIDFLVITVKDVEAEALNSYGFDRSTDNSGRGYWHKNLLNTTMDREITIIHYMVGEQGNVKAGNLVSSLLGLWRPRCVCVLGIAGGIQRNGVSVGDILIGDQFFYYSLTKEMPDGSQIRLESVKPDSSILSQIHLFKDSILDSLSKSMATISGSLKQPKVLFGPMFCGESVYADVEKTEKLLKIHPKGIGIEMESYGVYNACSSHLSRPRPFTIRGVSDYADAEKGDANQPLAATRAAWAFVGIAQNFDLSFTSYNLPYPTTERRKSIVQPENRFPQIFEENVDEEHRIIRVSGVTTPGDLAIYPYHLWVVEEEDLPRQTSVKMGIEIDLKGKLERIGILGWARLNINFVVLDVYGNLKADVPIKHFFTPPPLPFQPAFQIVDETVSEKRKDITYQFFLIPIPFVFEPGPYLFGVRFDIQLSRGSVSGYEPDKPFEIRVSEIEIVH